MGSRNEENQYRTKKSRKSSTSRGSSSVNSQKSSSSRKRRSSSGSSSSRRYSRDSGRSRSSSSSARRHSSRDSYPRYRDDRDSYYGYRSDRDSTYRYRDDRDSYYRNRDDRDLSHRSREERYGNHPPRDDRDTYYQPRDNRDSTYQNNPAPSSENRHYSTLERPVGKKTSGATVKIEPQEVSQGKLIVSMVWNLLFYVFTISLIATSALFYLSSEQDKSIYGFRIFTVLTDSMVPQDKANPDGGFYSGDIIIVKDIEGDQAEVGDIITYHPSIKSKSYLTHRVVEKLDELSGDKGTYYVTKGDANNSNDMPVNALQVVGKKVFTIPRVGGVLDFVRENIIVSVIFILSLLGFIYVMRLYFFQK